MFGLFKKKERKATDGRFFIDLYEAEKLRNAILAKEIENAQDALGVHWTSGRSLADAIRSKTEFLERMAGVDFSPACDLYEVWCAEREKLIAFVRDIESNWDCDDDAHNHGTTCRACQAAKLLEELEVGDA